MKAKCFQSLNVVAIRHAMIGHGATHDRCGSAVSINFSLRRLLELACHCRVSESSSSRWASFARDPGLGIVGFRVADEHGHTERRWVPRLRAGDPMRGGQVTAFLGGGHAFSVPMLGEIGLWPAEFFFGHEESDLAWRALDAGWKIRYEPGLVLQHPTTSPARHATYYRFTARNRVWLVRRRLPAALIPVHLGVWIFLTMMRMRSRAGLVAWWRGFAEGVRRPCGAREPVTWRTVWRMTRLGRPPIL